MNIRFACFKSRNKPCGLFAVLLLFISLLAFSMHSYAQGTGPLTGAVRDSATKAPIDRASVVIKGSRQGTSTDKNGMFSLDISGNQALLLISCVGYRSQELIVQKGKPVTVYLGPAIDTFGAVVITAFGRRERKEAVVGSVTSIQPGELKIPASNLTNALAGRVAGMISFQRGGQPGLDNSSFFIRGVTTLGYSNTPLILVDNVELTANDLARLQVDDIASFSILKDASAAALYGARGANGVILVTTKEGKAGKAKVELRAETATSMPTKSIELADPVTYMRLYNEAGSTRPPFKAPFFDQNKIIGTQKTLDGAGGINPYIYPAVDWLKTIFKDQTETRRANFSVSGGNDLAKYYIAGSYSRDNGMLRSNPVNNFNSGMRFENYQLRANTSIKVTSTTEVGIRLWGNFNDYTGPISNQGGGFATDLYSQALHANPVGFQPYYAPDSANRNTKHILFGNDISQTSNLQANPYASLMYGYKTFSESRMSAQFEVNQDLKFITPGLTFFGMFSTNRYSYFDLTRNYVPFYYDVQSYDEQTGDYKLTWLNSDPSQGAREYLSYQEGGKNQNTYVYIMGRLDYSRNFGPHTVGASLVGTRQQTLTGNAGNLQASLPNRNLGVSGRASYSYGSRYFLEFNFGYNGSEKFAPDHRFGFFPTIGAGWVVSNEKFWGEDISNVITRLKLRGSIGLVGNDAIGDPNTQRFFYLSNVQPNAGPGAVFGTNNSVSKSGTVILAYPNPGVTWETSRKTNLAAELTLFKKLNITAEVYREDRYNILRQRGYIPVTVGIEINAQNNLRANLGKALSKGIDLNVNYRQDFNNGMWASVLGNLTLTRNKMVYDEEPEYRNAWSYRTGQMIDQPFGFIAERLFVDDKEALNSPTQAFGELPMGGDIKYRDVNQDGKIDQDDQVPIGLPSTPQMIYGFGFSVGYKSFDLSAFFQGSARSTFFIDPTATVDFNNNRFGTAPFANNAQILKAYADDHWSEENQNLYALYPRLSLLEVANNTQRSTWWLRDGSFIRLKSVEGGYTFPKRWSRLAHMSSARIYFSGLNLLTFSKFKLWDPELAGNGFAYPIQKVFNVGLKFEF